MPRLIPDSVNTSRAMASLSPKALALYFLIYPRLNSYGKLHGDPYTIKGVACRHVEWLDLKDIEDCLKEISEKTNLKFWADENGDCWIHDLEFEVTQKLRKDRMGMDKLPSYPGVSAPTPGVVREYSRNKGSNSWPEGEGEEEELIPPKSPLGGKQQESFSKFWKAYPNRKNKGKAEKAWQKLKPNEQLIVTILQAIERAKTSVDWLKDSGQYIPHPSTWLNAKGWEDEYKQGPPSNPHKPPDRPVPPEFKGHGGERRGIPTSVKEEMDKLFAN